jgi:hypothetical protein
MDDRFSIEASRLTLTMFLVGTMAVSASLFLFSILRR